MIDIDAIRQRAAAAQPGPWCWFGNTETHQVALVTERRGHIYIMGFRRWGTQNAQPEFNSSEWGLLSIGGKDVFKARVVYDVCPDAVDASDHRVYRQNFHDIDHADARFIAHSRQDVDDLLEEIDRLNAIIAAAGIEVQS